MGTGSVALAAGKCYVDLESLSSVGGDGVRSAAVCADANPHACDLCTGTNVSVV